MASDSPKTIPQTAGDPPKPNPPRLATSKSAGLTAAERALKASLDPREFRDVHLYSFSRRTIFPDGSIRIDKPQPIVAIGSILKDTDHFSKLLTSGFSESAQDPNDASPIRQCALESDYDYEMDSDLDEFEETDGSAQDTRVASPSSSKGKGRDDSKDNVNAPNPTHQDSKRRRILLPSIAHRTLKACVFYLYTGKINFLPLSSEGANGKRFALLTTFDNAAPACSPKSMYRLAESYGIHELQDLAYKEIVSHLRPENIVEEAFSSFFARYPRLREHAVSYLSQHYADRAIQNNLPDAIEKVVLGYMPHAGDVLRSLLGLRAAVASPKPILRRSALTSLFLLHSL
ncbi:hypothetical protein C8Q80DRAFT_686169 [Daedaleopsis nitida]|nr:hypothetical protein C8Q80DRAFT_686169 [Daedaleopsis nitida]